MNSKAHFLIEFCKLTTTWTRFSYLVFETHYSQTRYSYLVFETYYSLTKYY